MFKVTELVIYKNCNLNPGLILLAHGPGFFTCHCCNGNANVRTSEGLTSEAVANDVYEMFSCILLFIPCRNKNTAVLYILSVFNRRAMGGFVLFFRTLLFLITFFKVTGRKSNFLFISTL